MSFPSDLLGGDPKSIRRGQAELDTRRIRKTGGGRKKSVQNQNSSG